MSGEPMNGWRRGSGETMSAGEVAYEVLGEGPPVVLVHGTTNRSHLWRGVIPALADRFAVYVCDLLGFGDSEKGERDGWLDPAQARMLEEKIPGSELNLIPRAGHFVPEDAPEGVARELVAFLFGNRERT